MLAWPGLCPGKSAMPRSPDEKALEERLSKRYPLGQSPVVLEIERRVCGCDYGGTSWATRSEVDQTAELLALRPGQRLLDIGAGTGWPALYWALTRGCDAVLADVPLAGLRIAASRAAREALPGYRGSVAADGAALPFASGSFDTVSHSDVLCCLDRKLAALEECRRVIRRSGRMAFTVIVPAANLSASDRERAIRYGPPFVATAMDYRTMLGASGWTIAHHRDLTADYAEAVRRQLREEEAQAEALTALYGEAEFSETLARRRMTAQVAADGHLRRELYVTTTLPA
jgi:ubiquinone/menaquinone biosynthesis C-methylase UbiE